MTTASAPQRRRLVLRRRRKNLTATAIAAAAIALCCCSSSLPAAAADGAIPSLRSTPGKQQKHQKWGGEHVIRRVYGDHNADVRRELSRIEERIPRYSTGIPANPSHRLSYRNHPYDPETAARRKTQQRREKGNAAYAAAEAAAAGPSEQGEFNDEGNNSDRHRKLQDEEVVADDEGPTWEKMRIQFFTEALDGVDDGSGGAKIAWYKNEILPRTREFWSNALSVVPVQGRLIIDDVELDSRTYCGDPSFTAVPTSHTTNGVADADLLLYVSGSDDPRFCPERTLAVAVPCNFDQFDRPTAGSINVCLDNIVLADDGTASPEMVQDYVDVTIHEVAHVLGHSSNSYRFFWDPETGKPRTSRPFEARTVTCVNGEERTTILPGETTMQFLDDGSGNRYASLVTEKLRTIARNQFDCQSLEGAQLENQPTRADSCTGDHWDERLYYPEALSGIISPTANILSSLTLALMEDSGWYKANYTMSRMSPWGLGAGCEFVSDPCLLSESGEDGLPVLPDYSKGFFCNREGEKGCSSELTHKLACTVVDYYYYVPQNLPPSQFQYFLNAPSKGGPKQADYCPVYGSPYGSKTVDELNCQDTSNSPSFNLYSEVYGEESKCISSSADEGLCFRTACVQDTMQLQINVIGEWHVCEYDYQEINVVVGQGLLPVTLTCPLLSQACPDLFCPFNCAGRGMCDYTNTENGTVRPKCACFDETDTTPACSDSMVPDGEFLDDSTGLFDNIEENFFDPLIAVFVDHPETWSTASWAWAGGLLTIFLVLLCCICSSLWPKRKKGVYY